VGAGRELVMRECSGRRWGLTHAHLRAGPVTAPHRTPPAHHRRRRGTCASRMSQPPPPATIVSKAAAQPNPLPTPEAKPLPQTMSGRRGRCIEKRVAAQAPRRTSRTARTFQLGPPTPYCASLRIYAAHPHPHPHPTNRSRCPAAPFLSFPGPLTEQCCGPAVEGLRAPQSSLLSGAA
jgi:hypothetical protein